MTRPTLALALSLLLPQAACTDSGSNGDGLDGGGDAGGDDGGDDGSGDGDGTGDDGDDGSGTGGGGDGTDDDGSSGGDEGDTGDDGGDNVPPPATGIQIVDVTADQGVRVPVAVNGALVPGHQRNQALLANRPVFLRAFYEVDPGFATRQIYALLTVDFGDGTTKEYQSFETAHDQGCTAPQYDCGYQSAINSFNFLIEAEDSRPGLEYSIQLFETAPGHEDDVSDKVPLFPTDGSTLPIGIEERYMKMRVVIVPFFHNLGPDCKEAPDLNAEFDSERTVADFFAERLLAYNPADEVEVQVHSTVNFTGSAEGSSGILSTLQNLRFQDGADPQWYYYGVIRPCDGGPDFSGVAQLGSPSKSSASRRIGWGVWHASVGGTAGTFVHEIGHEQGRSHIQCSGDEAGADPSYPDHPDGDIENYGTDVIGGQLDIHRPEDHDYMTYCSSSWVSEWGWTKVFPWIEEISSWELGDDGQRPRSILLGRITADGEESWIRAEDYFDPAEASSGTTVDFYAGNERIAAVPAFVERYERSDDRFVIVPVPERFGDVTSLARVDADGAHAIDLAAIQHALPVKGQ